MERQTTHSRDQHSGTLFGMSNEQLRRWHQRLIIESEVDNFINFRTERARLIQTNARLLQPRIEICDDLTRFALDAAINEHGLHTRRPRPDDDPVSVDDDDFSTPPAQRMRRNSNFVVGSVQAPNGGVVRDEDIFCDMCQEAAACIGLQRDM